jgi:hypothetical protein
VPEFLNRLFAFKDQQKITQNTPSADNQLN